MNPKSHSKDKDYACGICLKISYINHDCLSNATTNWIGDMIILRAARDMDAGAEVLISYKNVSSDGSVERTDKMRKWGFLCQCIYCKDARETDASVVEKRKNLMGRVSRIPMTGDATAQAKVELLVKAIEATYTRPAHEVPRLLCAEALETMGATQAGMKQDAKALATSVKILECLGFIITGWKERQKAFTIVHWGHHSVLVILLFLTIHTIFQNRRDGVKAGQALEYARTAYRIFLGEDATFEQFRKERDM
jgi:hypothetical protein